MIDSPLHERILAAIGERSYRHVAEITAQNQETVRRYIQGQAPSVEFLSAMCRGLGLSAEWLLTGKGPMKLSDVKAHSLNQANASELLSAVAATLERLIERVERIELLLNTMETRLRVRSGGDLDDADASTSPKAASIDDALAQ